ncbi:unnamed protein product [Caenorhabditis brenneri]
MEAGEVTLDERSQREAQFEKLIFYKINEMDQTIHMCKDPQKIRIWRNMTQNQKVEYMVKFFEDCQERAKMKNWGKIPTELKMEYIELLDFPDRLQLRRTSRMERALVDSLTINFPYVEFDNLESNDYRNRTMGQLYVLYPLANKTVSPTKNKALRIFNGKTYKSAIDLFAYVLKTGIIDKLKIQETYSPDRFDKFMELLEKSAPFRIKELDIVAKDTAVKCFLKNAQGLEKIRLNGENSTYFPFDAFLEIPSFVNAKLVEINRLAFPDAAMKLAEKWIEHDCEIGATLRASVDYNSSKCLDSFIEKYIDRIIAQDDHKVRIRTNNDAKHILLEFLKNERGYQYNNTFISCSIISSDESVEDTDTEWTENFDRGILFLSGKMWPDPTFGNIIESTMKELLGMKIPKAELERWGSRRRRPRRNYSDSE